MRTTLARRCRKRRRQDRLRCGAAPSRGLGRRRALRPKSISATIDGHADVTRVVRVAVDYALPTFGEPCGSSASHPTAEPVSLRSIQNEVTAQNKKAAHRAVFILTKLVGARGFEPPTSRSQTERTTRLCYAPNVEFSRLTAGAAF